MSMFRTQPLRRQLFIAIVLLLVPVLAAAGWSAFSTLRERENDLARQARIIAIALAAYVDNDMAALDGLAADLTLTPAVQALDPAQSLQTLVNVVANRPSIIDLVLVRPDGSAVGRVSNRA